MELVSGWKTDASQGLEEVDQSLVGAYPVKEDNKGPDLEFCPFKG